MGGRKGGNKRPRQDDPFTVILTEGLNALRASMNVEAFLDHLNAAPQTQLTRAQVGAAVAQFTEEKAAEKVSEEQLDVIFNRAKRFKKRGGAKAEGEEAVIPLSELIWLVKHHGVEKTADLRLAARAALSKDSQGSKAFEAYYKAQGIVGDGEWDAMMNAFKVPLPMVARYSGSRAYSEYTQTLARQHVATLGNSFSELAWARTADTPEDVMAVTMPHAAYHSKEPALKGLAEWTQRQNSLGMFQFQEAVSLLPPLLLDPRPDDLVLDMCSAPGSKLLQAADIMLRKSKTTGTPLSGGIVSNEIDRKKASQILPARLKRSHTRLIMVVNSDARLFPNMYEKRRGEFGNYVPKRVLFDRIMADVPCSGDGTGRKDQAVWETWAPHYGLSLHPKQLQILLRGLDCLKVGGRLVYSTCSLNPIEDESVVAAALAARGEEVRLVESGVPGFKTRAGLRRWGVPDAEGKLHYAVPEDKAVLQENGWTASMFPPVADAAACAAPHPVLDALRHVHRVVPQDNDTSGFFLAVFERVVESPSVIEEEANGSVVLPRKERGEARPGAVAKQAKEEATEVKTEGKVDGDAAAPAVEKPKLTAEEEATEVKTEVKVDGDAAAPAVEKPKLTAEERRIQQHQTLGGMRNARLFYNLTNATDSAWQTMHGWYGLDGESTDALNTDTVRLMVELDEQNRAKKKKMWVTTPAIEKICKALIAGTQSNNVRVIVLGCCIFRSLKGKYLERIASESTQYRPAYEGSQYLASVASAHKLTLPLGFVQRLIATKHIPIADLLQEAEVGGLGVKPGEEHWHGPCLVQLRDEDVAKAPAGCGAWGEVWFTCVMLHSKLELAVEDHERQGILSVIEEVFELPKLPEPAAAAPAPAPAPAADADAPMPDAAAPAQE
eukprot:TRINITY_DN1950_c0_g1_i1.p1 TRINITY_DN1950_c0_g1~~TRINITY_DN1950_c0_g1_i1.p1  ORF type:complete len:893 (+),score=393.37 TRINITY_DN1950_c0_g1_i1:60-2738(+)